MSRSHKLTPLALAATGALLLGATFAQAQSSPPRGYGEPPDGAYPPAVETQPRSIVETVIVTAPAEHPDSLVPSPNNRIHRVWLSRPVRYDDLDLATDDGQDALTRRIHVAARDICGELRARYPTIAALSIEPSSCYRKAIESATAQVTAAVRHAWEVAER